MPTQHRPINMVFKNASNMKGRPHEKRRHWSTPISTEPFQNSEWWYRFFQAAWLWRHQKDNFYNTISQMRWTGYSNVKQCKIMFLKTVLKTRRRTMHKPRYDIVNDNAKYHVNQCESNANSHWKHQPCSSLRSLPINNVTKRPRPLRRSLVRTCGSPQTEMPWVAILKFYLHAFSKPAVLGCKWC